MAFDPQKLNYEAFANTKLKKADFTAEQLSAAGMVSVSSWSNLIQNMFSGRTAADNIRSQLLIAVILGAVGLPFVFVISVISFLSSGSGFGFIPLLQFLLFLAMVAGVGLAFRSGMKKRTLRQLQLLRFSLDNNMHYTKSAAVPANPVMFQLGHSRLATGGLSFPDGTYAAEYQYTVGSGKQTRTYSFQFVALKLTKKVPHLILNSRHNQIHPPTYDYDIKELELEGDFGQAFKLFVPPNYHIDALQILTPDVMIALMQWGAYYDFELVDNFLFLYADRVTIDPATSYKNLFTAAVQIAGEFDKQVKTYRDSHAAVAATGMKLARKTSWRTIAIIAAFVIAWLFITLFSGRIVEWLR